MRSASLSPYRNLVILAFTFVFVSSLSWGQDETASDIGKRFTASATVLETIMSTPDKAIPNGVMQRAVCVAVFPSTVQVAVLVGGKHGKGFATCRTSHGWSAPAPLDITGGSWGAQLGGEEVDLVMVITDEKGKEQLLSGKSNLGTETSVTAGPVGNHEWKINEDVLTYSRTRGVFAGTNLTGSSITEDQDDVRVMYGGQVSLSEILDGGKQAPGDSQPFLDAIGRYAGPNHRAN